MQNSKICYVYRDASNYKTYGEAVIKGSLKLNEIKPYFYDHQFFIPSEVGFKDLNPEIFTSDDHIWHKLYGIEPTEKSPTVETDSETLVAKFKYLSSINWNESEVYKKKGLI